MRAGPAHLHQCPMLGEASAEAYISGHPLRAESAVTLAQSGCVSLEYADRGEFVNILDLVFVANQC